MQTPGNKVTVWCVYGCSLKKAVWGHLRGYSAWRSLAKHFFTFLRFVTATSTKIL